MSTYLTEFGGKLVNGHFTRKYYVPRDENFKQREAEYVKECDCKDAYYCMYSYENNDIDHCNIISDFYIDFDVDKLDNNEIFEKLTFKVRNAAMYMKNILHIPTEDMHIYFSGSKGFHIVIPYKVIGIQPSQSLNDDYKIMASMIANEIGAIDKRDKSLTGHIDLSIYDRKRLFRIPNTINTKSGLYKVPVTLKSLYSITLDEMKEYSSSQHKEEWRNPEPCSEAIKAFKAVLDTTKKKNAKTIKHSIKKFKMPEKIQELLPCAKRLICEGVHKGQRNNATLYLASSIFQAGYSYDDTLEIVKEWNTEANDPSLPEREIITTVTSAYRMILDGHICGCSSFKSINMCVGKDCKLLKQ